MIEPTMDKKQPTHPKNVNFSFKKMEESTAQMTTDRAPSGVCVRSGINNDGL